MSLPLLLVVTDCYWLSSNGCYALILVLIYYWYTTACTSFFIMEYHKTRLYLVQLTASLCIHCLHLLLSLCVLVFWIPSCWKFLNLWMVRGWSYSVRWKTKWEYLICVFKYCIEYGHKWKSRYIKMYILE